jgi:hypothetical protein
MAEHGNGEVGRVDNYTAWGTVKLSGGRTAAVRRRNETRASFVIFG